MPTSTTKTKAAKSKAASKTKTVKAVKAVKTTKTKSKSGSATTRKKGLKDLDKILEDPVEYANSVTVKRLVTILQKMSDYYYTKAEPLVDDDTYDLMEGVLKKRDPDNAYLFQTGAPSAARDDVELPFGMPSLNKIKPGEKSLKRFFTSYTGPYIVSDKLDGISTQIYKDADGNVDMFSKTQTRVGKSKKHLLQYLFDQKVLDAMPVNTAVRGEILIAREDFKGYEEKFKNTRNTMAGLVNTDKVDSRLAEKAQVVMYGIISPRMGFSEQMNKLQEWGFKTVWHRDLSFEGLETTGYDNDPDNKYANPDINEDELDEMDKYQRMELKLEQILKYRRAESEFDCDGIVVTDDSKTYLYDDDANPTYAMAFKKNIQSDMKEVVVDEVIWEPSMYSVLKPVLKIKPVKISGVTITYVTAHNAGYVYDNSIGAGSVVKISRSGDVIPYIEEVITPSDEPDMPDMKYEWNDTNVDITVLEPDEDTDAKIQIKRNLHFFRTLGVKFLSEGHMTNLYNAGYTTKLSVVQAASERDEEPFDIDGLGSKMMGKIYDEIDRVINKPDLPKFMSGSLIFGMGMGTRKLRDLIKAIPDLLTTYGDSKVKDIKAKVLEVRGYSDISAAKVARNLKTFNKFVNELRDNTDYEIEFKVVGQVKGSSTKTTKVTKTVKATKTVKTSDADSESEELIDMSDQKIVLTGFRDQDIIDFIEDRGGKVTTSVSKNTTLVVYVPTPSKSSKLQKAEDLGVEMIKKEEFVEKYGI